MKSNSLMSGMLQKMKGMYMPQKAEGVAVMTMDGNVAIPVKDGSFRAIINGELVEYPAEMTLDFPLYTIRKSIDKVAVDDIIFNGSSWGKVAKINKNNSGAVVSFSVMSYSGTGKTIHPVKDILLNQSTVLTIFNMCGCCGTTINPMMFALLAGNEEGESNSFAEMMMLQTLMGQQSGNAMNPMMFALMANKGDNSSMAETMMMMSMMNGQNPMAAFCAPVAPAPAPEAPATGKKK